MTRDDYAEAVFYRASRGNPEEIAKVYRAAAQSNLPDALKKLAQEAVNAPWRSVLETDYALTVSGSSAPFASNTDLLPESIIACDSVTHSAVAKKFRPVLRRSDLEFEVSVPDCPYGFYFPTKIGVDFAYALASLTGILTVCAVKIPTLLTLDTRLDDRLVDVGMMLIQSGMPAAALPQEAPPQ